MEKFVVSARKYRPDNFKSVVGQEHITSTLINAISREQLAHAYLFCGPRGVGKTTCARIIAKAINCLNPTSDHEACGECESCRAFTANASFNIYELDAASNNSVDNIRSLNDQVRIPPQVGRYSIYIIDEVHMLTTAAFNAFLKTLEEPPEYVIFILATTEKHKILPTILSRCQVYEFKHISISDVVGYLKYISSNEGVTYDEESLNIIAQKADGCMRDALSMFDKVVTFCNSQLTLSGVSSALNLLDYDTYFSFVELTMKGDYNNALMTFDSVLKKGFDPTIFLAGLSNHLRDVLVAGNDTTLSLLGATGSLAASYKRQSNECSTAFIFAALDIIATTETTLKFSLNQRLATELAILKMCSISVPIASTAPVIEKPTIKIEDKQPTIKEEPKKEPIIVATEKVEVKEVLKEQVKEEIKVEVKEEVKEETSTPKPKRGLGRSLGITRLNTIQIKPTEESYEVKKESVVSDEQIDNYKVPAEHEKAIIGACRTFSERLRERNPRVSLAFGEARIDNGDLIIPVPNKILEDEISVKKAQSCEYLSKTAGVKIYNFTISVEQVEIEEKVLLLRNEDRYKYLLDENIELHNLTTKLDLELN